MNLFIFYLILLTMLEESVSAVFVCKENQTILLNTEEVVFFETWGFPYPYYNDPEHYKPYCSFTFKLSQPSNFNIARFVLAIPNRVDAIKLAYSPLKLVNSDTFTYSNYDDYFGSLFQGFAFFDDWADNSCPLESISRVKPFHFTNDSQIIQIQSSYYKNITRHHPCLWQFTAPKEFGFKFVILVYNLQSDVLLNIENSTDIIKTERDARNLHAYYNDDNYLRIFLSNSNQTFSNENFELVIQISIVLKKWKEVEAECQVIVDEQNRTHWQLHTGYQNNAICKFEYVIPASNQVQITGVSFVEAGGSDFLKFTDGNETFVYSQKTFDQWFIGNSDGTDRILKGEFISDGSIQSEGFEVGFNTVVCACANREIIISCTDSFVIINTNVEDDAIPYQIYCFRLHCNFTLKLEKTCQKKFISLFFHSLDEEEDIYKVIANDTEILLQHQPNRFLFDDDYEIILSSKNDIGLVVMTAPYAFEEITGTEIMVAASDAPELAARLILSDENPYISMNNALMEDKMYWVEVKEYDMNTIVEIYSNEIFSGIMYEDESLTTIITDCFTNNFQYFVTCQMRYRRFIIYPQSPDVLFFKLSSESAFATYIWTTSLKENVKIYAGIGNDTLLWQFNQKTSMLWKDIALNTLILTIEIPVNSSFLMHAVYDLPDGYSDEGALLQPYSISSNQSLKFTVIDYDIDTPFECYFCYGYYSDSVAPCKAEYPRKITHLGQEFIFSNVNITVWFNPVEHYYKLLLFVELL